MTIWISIVMTVHGRAAHTGRVIASLLDRKAKDVEFIDGGSTDGPRDIALAFAMSA